SAETTNTLLDVYESLDEGLYKDNWAGLIGSGNTPQGRRSAPQELPELREHLVRRPLLHVVTARHRASGHVRAAFLPDRKHVVEALHRTALRPQDVERALDALVDVRRVMLEVDRSAGAVVLAHRVHAFERAVRAHVLSHRRRHSPGACPRCVLLE